MKTRDSRLPRHVYVVGCCGIPGRYGGFETLAENLADFHDSYEVGCKLTITGHRQSNEKPRTRYRNTKLVNLPIRANGVMSIFHDAFAMLYACIKGADVVLLLGTSGGVFLPLLRWVFRTQFVVNIDGVEWQREKWGHLASWFLRASENFAVKFSDAVIVDNKGIQDYLHNRYGKEGVQIEYGGDQGALIDPANISDLGIPDDFDLVICRIEPENNTHIILDAYAKTPSRNLVLIGNWGANEYGRRLRSNFDDRLNIYMLDPIYDLAVLKSIKNRANLYVHGHSAGGTNPSLVEAMHAKLPVVAFDCSYNRHTTVNSAMYFSDSEDLAKIIDSSSLREGLKNMGEQMKKIADERYLWDDIARRYFELVLSR